MESKPFRLSRRSVLVAIGLTPAVLFSLKANAADLHQIEAWAVDPTHRVHPDVQAKFIKACEHLWNAAVYAMGGAGQMDNQSAVLDMALEKSGPKILEKLTRYSPLGYDDATMGCAGICGYFCAEKAGTKKVTAEIFEAAWDQTYEKVHTIATRAGRQDFGLAC
jgi:hypothetical protein